jgi:hypothetical protein
MPQQMFLSMFLTSALIFVAQTSLADQKPPQPISQEQARSNIERKAMDAARALNGGNLSMASDIFRQLLVEAQRDLGPTDVNTIAIMNNLATVYRAQRERE